MTPAPRTPRPWTPERRRDLARMLAITTAAVATVVFTYDRPLVCAALTAGLLAVELALWRTRLDALVAACGLVFGPALEYTATAAGLWRYPHTTAGLLPAWVFTLWPVVPVCTLRLTYAFAPPPPATAQPASRHRADALVGLAVLLVEIPLLAALGNARPLACTLATLAMLACVVGTQRSRQSAYMLVFAGVIGPLAESLPIAVGAWVYPAPAFLGMPAWLPSGWALFCFALVRLATGLDGLLAHRAAARASSAAVDPGASPTAVAAATRRRAA